MKILYSITKSEIGGAQVHVALLAKGMKDAGHAVAIMSAPGGWLENEATRLGIRFYPNVHFANSFNPLRLMKACASIEKVVVEFQPDLVHAHSSFAGILTRICVMGRVPTIFTAHSWAFTDGASFFRKMVAIVSEKFVSRFTKKIICVSEYDKKLALKYAIAGKDKLVTIHNGVEERVGENFQRKNKIVSVGRLAYPKDFELLVEAFKDSEVEDFSLHIIGKGPDEDKIEKKIKDLKLEDRVFLDTKNTHEGVLKILQESSFFVLISKHEGLPITILEAMSFGLPIIASNVGGTSEEVSVSSGFLVENDKNQISSAIKKLSINFVRDEMGQASLERFKKEFTLEKFVSETKKVYEEVLS